MNLQNWTVYVSRVFSLTSALVGFDPASVSAMHLKWVEMCLGERSAVRAARRAGWPIKPRAMGSGSAERRIIATAAWLPRQSWLCG